MKALITFDQSCAAYEAKKGKLQITKGLENTGHGGKKNKDCTVVSIRLLIFTAIRL